MRFGEQAVGGKRRQVAGGDKAHDRALGPSLARGRAAWETALGTCHRRRGMGTVYEARHIVLGRREAVKILNQELACNPDICARFRREAWIAGSLESQHIVPVRSTGAGGLACGPRDAADWVAPPAIPDHARLVLATTSSHVAQALMPPKPMISRWSTDSRRSGAILTGQAQHLP